MRRPRALVLAVLAAAVAGCGGGSEPSEPRAASPLTLAVIGDTPYGDLQESDFPALVDAINRSEEVDVVLHVGDIKTSDSTCSAERFRRLRRLFDGFSSPFVLTPGDNEWTDCHLAAAGGYRPAERLRLLRRTFYPRRGLTLGARPMRVRSQAARRGFEPFRENVLWTAQRVVFSTVHVVGSNDGRDLPVGRSAFERRRAAALAWLDETFRAAARPGTRGVVLAIHADMFAAADTSAFAAVVERLRRRARAFEGPVLMINGDTHRFRVDQPLADVPNLTRIVVEGDTAYEWLRLDVDPRRREVFSYDRRELG
jgi:hypothetical protein